MRLVSQLWKNQRLQRVAKLCLGILCAGSVLFSAIAITSHSVRLAFSDMLSRSVARIWPVKFAFVGDSLTADCGLRWRLARFPFDTISFARGGADIRAVARQVDLATSVRASLLFVAAGVNDVLLDHASTEQVNYDFSLLLGRIPNYQRTVITLIPYISDKSKAVKITAANNAISRLAAVRRISIIDLNPILSSDGVRRPEMTTDGVHFTEAACAIWAAMIKGIPASTTSE
jgi:hypothetical protein